MSGKRKKSKSLKKRNRSNHILIALFLSFLLVLLYFNTISFEIEVSDISRCGDGTAFSVCSLRKPYFCDGGILVEKASVCGCNELLNQSENSCVSQYHTNPKDITLNYILRGEKREINFTVYEGMENYLSTVSRAIYYDVGETPSRADFKLKSINEKEQREFLLPLVTEIQSITNDKEDQIRIAVSIVQHIQYGFSEKTISLGGNSVNYSRYPYEVLYENQGICGEKSALLSFLLREMGYEIAFFYHAIENHESLGIKCPVEYSLDGTGYCFIETTAPSIITDNSIEYVGGITLESNPEIILISQGDSIGDNWEEYADANDMEKLRERRIPILSDLKLNELKEKYGLVTVYNPA